MEEFKKIIGLYIIGLYNDFKHKIKIPKEYTTQNTLYTLSNFIFFPKIINDQLITYGSYDLLLKHANYNKNSKVITFPFKESTNLDSLNIKNQNNIEIQVKIDSTEISRHFKEQSLKIQGKLSFEIFKKSIKPKEQEGDDIICISSTRWNYIWQRPQQLMERMSRNNRVLFLNHSFPVGYEDIKEKLEQPRLWNKRLTQINENLWVFSTIHLNPTAAEDLPDKISLEEFNNKVKTEVIRFLVNKLQFKNPIIITQLAESIKYIKEIPHQILCYDCIDDFISFSWTDKSIELLEEELIKNSDIILATANHIYQRINKIHNNTFLLPNAVEFHHFAKSYFHPQTPERLQKISKPIIGFVGAFFEWVDEDLINFLAKKRPEWNYVIIGPVQENMGKKLRKKKNVIFLDTIDYKYLPNYISAFDVCLIPFKINDTTRSANPIKMWEYLATSKPIVSTPIPEAQKLKNHIYIGQNKHEFLLGVEKALKEKDWPKTLNRLLLAERNDWDYRVNQLMNLLKNLKDGETNENPIYK